jgi:Abnormal spindle-like microcephaly-assoc'd, ASPM-SPD-2-Hydin
MKNSARLALCALACLIFGCVSVKAQNITTVVGGGPTALTPTGASVGSPVAIHRDAAGNAYILDNTFSRVLKIDATTGLMSVYAGNGTTGFSGDGNAAVSAQMNQPSGLCVDGNSNVFVADSDNAVIRVIIGPGAVTPPSITGPVVAGNIYTAVGIFSSTNQIYGGDNGPALAANLHFPDGCAFDSHGNMYIADRGNNEVRVVIGTGAVVPAGLTGPLTAGSIYVFAGGLGGATPNPPAGGFAAENTAARGGLIYGPFDVAVDSANNVYIADLGNNFGPDGTPNVQIGQPNNNNVVRMVSAATGNITTVAGVPQTYSGASLTGPNPPVASGVATAVALNEPKGLSVDTAGNLYFSDAINQVIRKVSGGNVSVVAGTLLARGYSGDKHAATSATLTFPAGTYVDSNGNIFIADDGSNAVREVPSTTSGTMTALDIYTVAGNGHLSFGGDTAPPASGLLNTPAGLAVDAAGDIFVADGANDAVRKVSGIPALLSTIAGQPEAGGFLNSPIFLNGALGVAADASGNAYIADTANCLVRKVTSTGITTIAGVEPAVPVPDNSANAPICGFTAAGGAAVGTKLGTVNSVAVDSNGDVFFSDKTNNVVWEVPKTTAGALVAGNAYIVAGVQSVTGAFAGDGGPANAAKLSGPTGIYVDIFNNLFIADAGNHRIREVPAKTAGAMTAGSIYTIAGTGASGNTGDSAAATAATLATPFAVVVDTAGNVFFSDTTNETVREIAGSTAGGLTVGDIYTVAGTKNVAGFTGDGAAATSAQLNAPQGLALQANASPSTTANLLVSDSGNNRVRSVANIGSNAVALASLSPDPLTFPSGTVGTASAPLAVTLTNGGGAVLTVTAKPSIAGANASDFTIATENCSSPGTVAAGGTCAINVVFTPTANGARTATLTVTDNAASGSQTITLNGTAAAAVLALTVKDTDPSSTQTVAAGSTATYNLSVAGNLPVTATLTCTGAPTAAVCTPAPASVAITPTAAGTFKVTVTTTARGEMLPFNQPSVKMQPPSFLQIAPMASLALLFVIAMMLGSMQNPGRMRLARVALSLCLILMPIAAATVLVGCGGGSSTPPPPPATGTPAGTYTITVTATSGSTTASTPLTLIVN